MPYFLCHMAHEIWHMKYKEMARIAGGTFLMGSNDHYPEEAPAHYVTVEGFWMDKTPVTNEQFSRFVEATGY